MRDATPRAIVINIIATIGLAILAMGGNGASAQVAVSDGGGPSFVSKIATPPGVRGMSPNLALVYGGSNEGGPIGYGWSLQAGAFFTRCGATIGIDGRKIGVSNGIDDKLCLNGQRLIHVNASTSAAMVGIGTNDAAGVASGSYNEFHTESDSYFRIRSYGYANGDATGASGPAFFKVWTKTGQIIEYGASPSADANTKAVVSMSGSTVGLVWATARMSDVVGNHIDYKYEQRDIAWGSGTVAGTPTSGHEWNLLEVQFSGNKVVFNYSDRAATSPQDASEAYSTIGKNVNVRLLNSVTTYVNSPNPTVLGPAASAVAVQTLKLTFDNGPTSKRSRLKQIRTCAGAATSTRCLPATSFAYAPGGNDAYIATAAFNQSTLQMQSSTGSYGVLVGDFNGDGRTDLIRWSAASPASNQMLMSNGDGSFTPAANFNITNQTLFSTDGCYVTFVTDINGDGLPDLIRSSTSTISPTGTTCPAPVPSLVYINKGDGSFAAAATYTGPTLLRDSGHNFYLLDYDGDGKVDLVTAVAGTVTSNQIGNHFLSCKDPSGVCTHVYHGNGDGTFTEVATNVGGTPVGYGPALGADVNLVGRIADLDGDGLQDIGGIYDGDSRVQKAFGLHSHGDGTFDAVSAATCVSPIDFNGDGVPDCLNGGLRTLSVSPSAGQITNFNLTAVGQELAGTGIGFAVADVNGDGKQDIIRWEDDPTKNVVYLSNGDGTFTASTTFNLSGIQLQKSDGSATMMVGDFTGHGNAEILRIQTVGAAVSNQLYVKQDSTPADQLTSVTTGTGATTSFYYVPLANSTPVGGPSANLGPRYVSDALTAHASTFPTVDLTPLSYVVATTVTDSGVGTATISTEMAYAGLKTDARGRGLAGFRDVKRQSVGANGNPLTVENQYLQSQPYIGMVASTATFNSALNATSSANMLQQDTRVYCDQTLSGATATAIATGVSCPTTSTIQRPYLLYTTHTAKDLAGVALPTVTTQATVNANADPTLVVVKTTGSIGGVAQTFTKTSSTAYQPDITTCSADGITCSWILSRATQETVERAVPNSLASLTTSAGSSSNATATQGTGPIATVTLTAGSFSATPVGGSSTSTATLSNATASAVTLTVPSAASITGTGFAFVSTTCAATLAASGSCSIIVRFTPTAVSGYSGALSVSTSLVNRSATLAATGAAPVVTITPQRANWGTVGIGSDSGDWPTITNSSSVPILITGHSLVSGPAGAWSWQGQSGYCIPGTTVLAAGGTCKTFFGMGTSTAIGAFNATDQVSYQAVGITTATFTVQQNYAWSTAATTASVASVNLAATTVNATSAQQTYTLTNNATGSPVNIAIAVVGNQPANFPMSNNCGASLAAGASCTVTVAFNPTWVASGFSAAVQVATTYPRMSGGAVEAYYYAAPVSSVALSGNSQGSIATLTSAATLVSAPLAYGPATRALTATYRNDGNLPMTLATPALAAPVSVTSNNCSNVAPGAGCSMGIVVAASVPGISVNQSFVPSGSNVPPAAETVNWTTPTAIPNLSPTTLSFGTIAAGTTSRLNLTLTNGGNSAYDWSRANLNDTVVNMSFDFSACTNVAPNASCTVVAIYSPTAIESDGNSNLAVVQGTGPSGNTITVSGNGGGSTATRTSAASLVSPEVWYGSAAQSVTATYRNDGNLPMTLASPALSAPLSVASNNCSGIAAGASCSIVVSVATNVPGVSINQSFTPTGAFAAPAATTVNWGTMTAVPNWSTTSLAFGTVRVGSSATQFITLTNDGNVPYNWNSNPAIANLPAGFRIDTSECINIAPGSNCNASVTFTPTAVGTTYSGSGVTMAAASYNTNTMTLTGTGGGATATLTSAPTLVQLANWYGGAVSTVTASYRNDGNVAMTLASPALAAPLSVNSNSCTNVAVGASCSIVVNAATNIPGISVSQAFTPTGANAGPAATTVVWTTQTAVPRWSPTSLDFGTAEDGTTPSKTITLYNDGNVAYNWAANNGIANPPSNFSFNTSACGNVVPGGSCNVVVTFLPGGYAGYAGGSITMTAASYNTNTFSVNGVAQYAPQLQASPSSFSGSSYAPQPVSTTIAISNSGMWPTTFNLSMTGGATVSPSSLSCPTTGACGSVTVTTPTAVGNYSGTLTGTSSAGGSVPSVPMTLTVASAPTITAFTVVTTTGLATTFKNPNSVAVTPTDSGMAGGGDFGSVSTNTCTGSIAAGGTCTITLLAPAADCKPDSYTANAYVTDAGGTVMGATVSRSSNSGICR